MREKCFLTKTNGFATGGVYTAGFPVYFKQLVNISLQKDLKWDIFTIILKGLLLNNMYKLSDNRRHVIDCVQHHFFYKLDALTFAYQV